MRCNVAIFIKLTLEVRQEHLVSVARGNKLHLLIIIRLIAKRNGFNRRSILIKQYYLQQRCCIETASTLLFGTTFKKTYPPIISNNFQRYTYSAFIFYFIFPITFGDLLYFIYLFYNIYFHVSYVRDS